MQMRGDTASPGDDAGTRPLFDRALRAAGYLIVAGFLCWRIAYISETSSELVALPAFLCISAALILIVLAVLTLVRTGAREEGPS